jgi:hypothetical protein
VKAIYVLGSILPFKNALHPFKVHSCLLNAQMCEDVLHPIDGVSISDSQASASQQLKRLLHQSAVKI